VESVKRTIPLPRGAEMVRFTGSFHQS